MTEQKPNRMRIKYPIGDRPSINLLNQVGEIINLSPTGVKFKASLQLGVEVGTYVTVKIVLCSKGSHLTTAYCVRKVGDLYMLRFETKLSSELLQREYEHLKNLHGTVDVK